MANIKPFQCIRPSGNKAKEIAALPYDVYNTEEARKEIAKNPISFLRIDRAETQFDELVDIHHPKVYQKARDLLEEMIENGDFLQDKEECYYVYELTMGDRSQTGLVACAFIDDYLNGIIKKHENTRTEKELDRINHVDICNAQTGPIFLAYRTKEVIKEVIKREKINKPIYDFTTEDKIIHRVWRIDRKEDIVLLQQGFEDVQDIYIADGHHRAASAVKVGLKRREENKGYSTTEEFNYFLSVLFPEEELKILSYNRAVKDLKGLSCEEFKCKVEESFTLEEMGTRAYTPESKGAFGMYLDGIWYKLTIKDVYKNNDPVEGLDVSLLQNLLFDKILGIVDPCIDERIDFIGGIRGLGELEKRVKNDMAVAFSMYPTHISELFAVSDKGKLMPPKSTWFEPKLRSGLFIHKLTKL